MAELRRHWLVGSGGIVKADREQGLLADIVLFTYPFKEPGECALA